MRKLLALMMVVSVVGCGRCCNAPKRPFSLTGKQIQIDPDAFVRGKPVKIEVDLPGEDESIVLDLKPGRDPDDEHQDDLCTWVADVQGGNIACFMLLDGVIEAHIPLGDKIYQMHGRSPTAAVLEVVDTGELGDEDVEPGIGAGTDAPGQPAPESCGDPPDRIDLMVLYTAAAAERAELGEPPPQEGVTPIENQIAIAVGLTNEAFLRSGASDWIDLVYTGEAPEFSETPPPDGRTWAPRDVASFLKGDLTTAPSPALVNEFLSNPTWLESIYDPAFARIHALRESEHADLVSLVFEQEREDDGAGAEYDLVCAQGDSWYDVGEKPDLAFSVVRRSCSSANLSLAHEIGHNLGAHHDRDPETTYPSSQQHANFGHRMPEPTADVDPWRTVMAVPEWCREQIPEDETPDDEDEDKDGCIRIPVFSNPQGRHPEEGDATGVEGEADNVEEFKKNVPAVSRYRCRRSGDTADVWMKDRWEDQGGEPRDRRTRGKPMWQSPYVWVRRDGGAEHDHFHQNPVPGEINYVYVKIANDGGEDESGRIEVYYYKEPDLNSDNGRAENDPANWELIGAKPSPVDPDPLTIEAGKNKVVKFEWTMPDHATGQLLARWRTEPDDSDTVPFVSPLDKAVRRSNDLIWRNTHVIELDDLETSGEREEPDQGNEPDGGASVLFSGGPPLPFGGGPTGGQAQSRPAHDRFEFVFSMASDAQSPDTYLLIAAWPLSARKVDWAGLIDASIRVEADFLHGLTRTGGAHQGHGQFEHQLDAGVRLIGPFHLEGNQTTKITFAGRVNSTALEAARAKLANPVYYEITVMQMRRAGVDLEDNPSALFEDDLVVRGVTYVLRMPAARRQRLRRNPLRPRPIPPTPRPVGPQPSPGPTRTHPVGPGRIPVRPAQPSPLPGPPTQP